MLRLIVDNKISYKLLIIQDEEHLSAHDVFIGLLMRSVSDESVNKLILVCKENPPEFYLSEELISSNKKIKIHNTFSNPCEWNDSSSSNSSALPVESFVEKSPGNVIFIDSISFLAHIHGFENVYRVLSAMKSHCSKLVCLAHGDLFSNVELEELYFLSTIYIKLLNFADKQHWNKKSCEVTYKKPGGKILKQKEVFVVNDDYSISSCVVNEKKVLNLQENKSIKSLTTFDLGTEMKEEERKAKENLVLPYLRAKTETKEGEILYQADVDEWEDDPDDDLDI